MTADVRLAVNNAAPPLLVEKPRAPAGNLILGAARIRAEIEASSRPPLPGERRSADSLEERARQDLPARAAEIGAGGELVPTNVAGTEIAVYRNTVEKPDYVTAAASRDRLDLLNDTGALETGLDVADTIEARNSLEMMLAHQQAVLHRSTMKIGKQLNRALERMDVINASSREQANVEAARLVNMMSRLSSTFQQGMTTLDRVRTGNRQTVIVRHQHVTVNEGGQAVVANGVAARDGGNGKGGTGGKNE